MAYDGPNPLPIVAGGTNANSMTNTDGVVYFDGTKLNTTTVGTATHVLTSNGAGLAPTFQAVAGGSFSGFSAYVSAASLNDVSGDGTLYTVICDTATINVGSNYNTGTGAYTAPSTGNYEFNANLYGFADAGAMANAFVFIYVNGVGVAAAGAALTYSVTQGYIDGQISAMLPLTIGDVVTLRIIASTAAGTKTFTLQSNLGAPFLLCYFNGKKLS